MKKREYSTPRVGVFKRIDEKLSKSGFTLTELLIALGVIGVLAAVLMPVVHNIISLTKML